MGRKSLDSKPCKSCGEVKTRDSFAQGGTRADCKDCDTVLSRVKKHFKLGMAEAREKVKELKRDKPNHRLLYKGRLCDVNALVACTLEIEGYELGKEWKAAQDKVNEGIPNGHVARGISWDSEIKKFRVRVNNKWIGCFFTFEGAVEARDIEDKKVEAWKRVASKLDALGYTHEDYEKFQVNKLRNIGR